MGFFALSESPEFTTIRYARQMAIHVVQAGLACCGVEAGALDVLDSALNLVPTATAAGNHILVIAGTITQPLAPVVKAAYDELAEPKVVVAFGVCAISGGPYWDSYSVVNGAGQIVPVDIHVPGCPPTPQDLARAITQAQELVNA